MTIDITDDLVVDGIQLAIVAHLRDQGVFDVGRDMPLLGKAREIFLQRMPEPTSEELFQSTVDMLRYLEDRGVIRPGEAILIIERARGNYQSVVTRAKAGGATNEVLDRIVGEVADKLEQLYAKWPRN